MLDSNLTGSPRSQCKGVISPLENTAPSSPEQVEDSLLRLFVGCIPPDVDEDQLRPIFELYGEIEELQVARDESEQSLCYCTLKYATRVQFEEAIAKLNGLFYMGQMTIPLQVRFLEPDLWMGEHKVFVGGLPADITPSDLRFHLTMQYGPVFDVHMLKRAGHLAHGAAFVKFLYRSSAEQLIEDAAVQAVFLPNGDYSETIRASYAINHFQQTRPWEEAIFTESGVLSQRQRVFRPSYASQRTEFSPVKLFVGCLPYSKTAVEVAAVFEQFGPLVEVAILTDTEGRSRGAAFVTFTTKEAASDALDSLTGFVFPNSTRPINISLAHKQGAIWTRGEFEEGTEWGNENCWNGPAFMNQTPLVYFPSEE